MDSSSDKPKGDSWTHKDLPNNLNSTLHTTLCTQYNYLTLHNIHKTLDIEQYTLQRSHNTIYTTAAAESRTQTYTTTH